MVEIAGVGVEPTTILSGYGPDEPPLLDSRVEKALGGTRTPDVCLRVYKTRAVAAVPPEPILQLPLLEL